MADEVPRVDGGEPIVFEMKRVPVSFFRVDPSKIDGRPFQGWNAISPPPPPGDEGWEARMAERAKRRKLEAAIRDEMDGYMRGDPNNRKMTEYDIPIPVELRCDPPEGHDDTKPRHWCSDCGLIDFPQREDKFDPHETRCPRCGCRWSWFGRVADINGTATTQPPGHCLDCFEWRRFTEGQEHFGWSFWLICSRMRGGVRDRCDHEHHLSEVWMA